MSRPSARDEADTHRIDKFLSDVGWVVVGLVMMFLSELITHNFVLNGVSNSRELMVEDNRALVRLDYFTVTQVYEIAIGAEITCNSVSICS